MNKRQAQFANTLRSVQRFLDQHIEIVGTLNRSAARAELDDALASIERFWKEQTEHHRRGVEETSVRQRLIEEIRTHHLRPIVTIGLAYLNDTRNLEIPRAASAPSNVMAQAACIAARVRGHLAVFVANGLSPDFLLRLESAVSALQRSVNDGDSAASSKVGATAGLAEGVRRGQVALRVISTQLRAKLASNPEALEAWERCLHPEIRSAA